MKVLVTGATVTSEPRRPRVLDSWTNPDRVRATALGSPGARRRHVRDPRRRSSRRERGRTCDGGHRQPSCTSAPCIATWRSIPIRSCAPPSGNPHGARCRVKHGVKRVVITSSARPSASRRTSASPSTRAPTRRAQECVHPREGRAGTGCARACEGRAVEVVVLNPSGVSALATTG